MIIALFILSLLLLTMLIVFAGFAFCKSFRSEILFAAGFSFVLVILISIAMIIISSILLITNY